MPNFTVGEIKSKNIFLLAASLSFLEVALLSSLSFLLATTSLDRNFWIFLLFALLTGMFGFLSKRFVRIDREFNAGQIFQLIALNFCILALLCSLIYIAADVRSTFDGALLEAVSGLTTTSLTNVSPEALGKSILFFRSASQWMGGLGALILVFVALPAAGRSEEFDVSFAKSITSQTVSKTLHRLAKFYCILTLFIGGAFLIAGMTFFESLCHAFSAVSTGGFSTRNASISGFDSGAIEWVVAASMIFSAMNIVILWWIWKRKFRLVAKNSELQFFALLVVVCTLLFGVWIRNSGSFEEVSRDSFFLVASLFSTTGFFTVHWEFPSAMTGIVLLLLGTGAMAGSTGGGYGSGRLLQHYHFARRELTQQLKPNSVRVVKVSGRVIDERALQRLHGFTAIYIALVAIGALCIAFANSAASPVEALSLSLTALATAGPFVGSGLETSGIDFNAGTNIMVSILMFIGRLSIFPVAYLCVALLRTFREGPIRKVRYQRIRR